MPNKYVQNLFRYCFLTLLLLPLSTIALFSTPSPAGKPCRIVLHIHSNFSEEGVYPLEDIVRQAETKGLQGLILTDHALLRWEYGMFPFRGIVRRVVEKQSVLTAGVESYLAEIDRIGKIYPGLLIIPGVESAAAYFWEGSPWGRRLVLREWNKHILIVGLSKSEDYRKLPLLSNPYRPGEWQVWPLFFTLLCLLIGLGLFFQRQKKGFLSWSGIFFLVLAGLNFLFFFPYRSIQFDPYHGDPGYLPYQQLLDYVRQKNGLTFWSHPEAPDWQDGKKIDGVTVKTEPYPSALSVTRSYTGFAILWEGYNLVGKPGGIWDQLLTVYCSGERDEPIWAVGELDYLGPPGKAVSIDAVQNVLFVPQLNKAEIIQGFRWGNFYVLRREETNELFIPTIRFVTGEEEISLGGTILNTVPHLPYFSFRIESQGKPTQKLRILLIRNGEVIRILEGNAPGEFLLVDEKPVVGSSFYRMEIQGEGRNLILTNPVFLLNNC